MGFFEICTYVGLIMFGIGVLGIIIFGIKID